MNRGKNPNVYINNSLVGSVHVIESVVFPSISAACKVRLCVAKLEERSCVTMKMTYDLRHLGIFTSGLLQSTDTYKSPGSSRVSAFAEEQRETLRLT